ERIAKCDVLSAVVDTGNAVPGLREAEADVALGAAKVEHSKRSTDSLRQRVAKPKNRREPILTRSNRCCRQFRMSEKRLIQLGQSVNQRLDRVGGGCSCRKEWRLRWRFEPPANTLHKALDGCLEGCGDVADHTDCLLDDGQRCQESYYA